MRRQRARKSSPSGVGTTRRVERATRRTLSAFSSRVTSFDKADGLSLRSRAAEEKLPASIERTKASISPRLPMRDM
jgi:hypothetical protein